MKGFVGFLFMGMVALTIAAQFEGPEDGAPYKPVGKCPKEDGKYPVFLPDSEDRTIFYMCSKGVPYLKKCPPKTEFCPELNVCVHPK